MLYLKYVSVVFFLMTYVYIFSQKEKKEISFSYKIKDNTEKYISEPNFKKARQYFLLKNWDSTLIYSLKQLSKSDSRFNINEYCYFFRGYSFQKKKILKESKREYHKITKNFIFYNYVLAYLGEIAMEERSFEKSIDFFSKSIIANKNYVIEVNKDNIYQNLGINYLHLKNYIKSECYLLKSMEIETDTLKLIRLYGNLATLYYEQYKDDLAIPYFKKAYEFSKAVDNFTLKSNTAKNMAVVEENRKDVTAALKYRKEYEQWNDSLNNHNKIWELAQLEKKLAVEKKQVEVNLLKAENKAKIAERNSFLYITMALSILLFVIIVFYRKNIKSKRTILAQKEQLDTLNETKDRLFSIVSHDLRSSVNTFKLSNKKVIKNLEKENIKNAHKILQHNSTIVSSAYNLLDNLLNWAMLQTQQSYFEIEENHLFFTIEHVVYNYIPLLKEKELQLKNLVDKTTKVMADQESLKIILRNLLDNAIKFSDSEGDIKIYTQDKDTNFLDIVIEDSGIGMDVSTREKLVTENITVDKRKHTNRIGSGLGLQLCKSMIQKNKGKLSIESELGKGTKMIVSLPKLLING